MSASAVIDRPAVPTHDVEGRGIGPNGRLARLPALDGIRGMGIPFVLLYHHGMKVLGIRFGGGFLTVSMFFTLSGFLITRLLLQEHRERGHIDLGAFYTRRVRRLMPAALTTIGLIVVFWTAFPGTNRPLDFRSVFWAMFYGTNINQIALGNSYNDLFASRSPLLHTWSLSLEEQIYLVFPLLLIGVLGARRLRARTAPILFGLAAAGFAVAWYWTSSIGVSRAYYATEARAGEFLMGAAFACFWSVSPRVPAISRRLRSVPGQLVGLALVAVEVWLWWIIGMEDRLFHGATIANSVVVCALMAYACAAPTGQPAGLMSWRPFVEIGQRAYTIYLVHWPVFVFLDTDSTGLGTHKLLLLRLVVTFGISEAVYRGIETRVLRSLTWPGNALYRGCALLAAAVLVVAPFAPHAKVDALVDNEAVALQQRALDNLPQYTDADPSVSSVDPALPARVLVVGDSQSWIIGGGMKTLWGEANGVRVEPSPGVGCGVTPLIRLRYLGEDAPNGRTGCKEWRDALPAILDKFQPQLVIVVGGFADLADHYLDGSWQHIGDPPYDDFLRNGMQAFADEMGDTGARVLWLTHPHVDPPDPPGVEAYPEEDPARMDRYNEFIEQLAADDPNVVSADLATFVRDRPGGEFDPTFRPDGAHMDLRVAPDVVQFLADAIREAVADEG